MISSSLLALGLMLALAMGGCASGSLTRVGGGPALPQDLPAEFHDRFEIKEVGATKAREAALAPEPAGGKSKKKKKKKGKDKTAPAVAAPFVIPSRRPAKDPMWVGEKEVFEITYFGMSAGDFTIEILPFKEINSRKVYSIRGSAVSSKVFSLFYRINDQIETFFDYDGLFSHRFHLVLDESKQTRDALELYDSEKAQTFYWNRWNHKEKQGPVETKEFAPMIPFSQDSLSALYYLRSVPLPDGAVVNFPVASEGKGWEAVVTVVRREMMDTPLGRVQTIVVKPETKYQGVLQKRGDSYIWLTDDDRRFVLRLEAKVKIGTVVAAVKKIETGTPPQ